MPRSGEAVLNLDRHDLETPDERHAAELRAMGKRVTDLEYQVNAIKGRMTTAARITSFNDSAAHGNASARKKP